MTQNSQDGFDPLDPMGTWRAVRDANLDAWAKSMAGFANTDAFAKAIGLQLDTMLAASAPMQEAMQQYMERYLAQVNMPSRHEVVSLAERMTNIEMRLDDMQAQLDDIQDSVQDAPKAAGVDLAPIQKQLDQIMAMLKALPVESTNNGGETPTRARRTRKAETES